MQGLSKHATELTDNKQIQDFAFLREFTAIFSDIKDWQKEIKNGDNGAKNKAKGEIAQKRINFILGKSKEYQTLEELENGVRDSEIEVEAYEAKEKLGKNTTGQKKTLLLSPRYESEGWYKREGLEKLITELLGKKEEALKNSQDGKVAKSWKDYQEVASAILGKLSSKDAVEIRTAEEFLKGRRTEFITGEGSGAVNRVKEQLSKIEDVDKAVKDVKNGAEKISQRGSHAKFKLGRRTIIVPTKRREIPFGTFRSIVRQSGLSEADFN